MRKPPFVLVGCFAAALLASFLDWGAIPVSALARDLGGPSGGMFGQLGRTFDGLGGRIPFDAWHSNLNLVGLTLPNWLCVIAAAAIAGIAWFAHTNDQQAPRGLLMGLAIYGLAHTGLSAIFLLGDGGAPNVGAVLMIATFITALVTVLQAQDTRRADMASGQSRG